MKIVLNGAEKEVGAATVAALIAELQMDTVSFLSVSCNRRVVPKARWAEERLAEGDSVDIFSIVGGG